VNVELVADKILLFDSFKQRAACAALVGARWSPGAKAWIVDATPANVASLAALCPALPPELRALLPAAPSRVVPDEGAWLTYDASLYDPALVDTDPDTGEVTDHNRDRAKPPWEHQRDAVGTVLDLFARHHGAALLMEQRTGKARISIEVFARLAQADLVRRVLVISLSTPCGDYAGQVTEYLDGSVAPVLLFGSSAKRKKLLAEMDGALQVAIINYESAWRLKAEILEWGPDMVIADEMHRIKGPTSKQSRGVHALGDAAAFRLGMTGTATPKWPLDLWSEYRFCDRGVFGESFFATKAVYGIEAPIIGAGGKAKTYTDRAGNEREIKVVVGFKRLDEFQEKMHSIAFVRRMDECHDLPPVSHIIVPVPLGPKAAAAYRDLTRESVVEWESGETSVTNVLARKLRQQQITSGLVPRDDGVLEVCGTEKLEALADTASGILEARRKVIVYARFSHEVEGALAMFDAAKVARAEISGRIPPGPKRDAEIDRFKNDPEVLGLACQIQAGGVGIDLSVAASEIFVSKTHDFVDYDQARARIVSASKADRLLTYYHLVCPGTVDEEIEESRELKCDLSLLLLNRRGNPYGGTTA